MQSAQLKNSDSQVNQPEHKGASGWPSATGIIVDTRDKDSWPTIGDNSEAASDSGDNASVKSVISSSSAPSQGHGDTPGQGQASNLLQGPNQQRSNSASNLWSSNMSSNEGSLDSESTWGITPPSSLSSSMWGNSSDIKGASTASGANIQNGLSVSSCGVNLPNSSTPINVGGWGDSLPSEGQFSLSGAQDEQRGTGSGQSNSLGNAMWQGIRNLSDFDKETVSRESTGWGSQSTTGSMMGPGGLRMSANAGSSDSNVKGVAAMNQDSANQWGQSSTPASSVWGGPSSSSGFESGKAESSGWGSPCPSPISNAGTEEWGQDTRKGPPQAWQQSIGAPAPPNNWNEPERRQSSSAWDDQTSQPTTPSGGGWGAPVSATPSSWGSDTSRPGPSAWGPPTDSKQNQSQWGSSGASGPQSQWPGSASQPPSNGNVSQIGAWGSGNPMSSAQRPPAPQVAQAPRPIGSQVPPPPTQPPQPSSWAEAATRGLPNTKPSPVGSTNRKPTKEDIMLAAINSTESWGKMPVRQDASWDHVEDSPKLPRKPLGSTSSSGSQEDLHWNQPNNGTAIWESAKEPSTPQAVPGTGPGPSSGNVWDRSLSGASGSTNEWGVSSDNDGGTWNGGGVQQHQQIQQHQPQPDNSMWQGPPSQQQQQPPPPPASQQWNQQPQPPYRGNQWGNEDRPASNSWSSGSSGSNDSKKNTWHSNIAQGAPAGPTGPPKSDNLWDKNGTSLWGDPEKTETGTWHGGHPGHGGNERRNSSTGSWDNEPGQWTGPGRDDRVGNFDSNAAYWDKPPTWQNQPTPVNPNVAQPNMRGPGDKGPMWGQPSHPSKPGWSDMSPPVGRDDAPPWNQAGKPGPPSGWGDAQWQQRPKLPSAGNWGDPGDWNGMTGSRKPPQRSRMLQQLMDMGFKKEDAQNALIRNDMDLDRAINDLVASAKRPDFGDPEMRPGRQLTGRGSSEDLADHSIDHSHFMPPPNTLTNAQGIHNTQLLAQPYGKPGPSLPHVSSLSAPSINPLQPKLLPQQLKPPVANQLGQPIRGQLTNQTQQMIQAQIVQQLQMAVQAGLISPQLLNQHLTPAMLVMLQQLLQLQQVYQQLMAQQQVLQQNKSLPPIHQRTQVDQISMTIAKIKQKIAQAQQALAKQAQGQPPPTGGDANKELLKDLQENISNLQLKDPALQHAQQQAQQAHQPQSRLNQWKLPSPEKEMFGGMMSMDPSRGYRPQVPHSTTNLQNRHDLGAQFSDPWSSLPTSSSASLWSGTSTATTTASLPQTSTKNSSGKESPSESMTDSPRDPSTDPNDPSTATATSSASLDIEEFVPGKPWQGGIKSVEDDPHLTPGQNAVRRQMSVSSIKDEYVMNTLGKSSSSGSLNTSPTVSDPTITSSANWGSPVGSTPGSLASSASSPNLIGKSWSGTMPTESAPSMFMPVGDIWGGGGPGPKSRRPPPGLMSNRSMSCPGGPGAGNSSWINLKNLPLHVDGATVKSLCNQHGALQTFLHSTQFGQAYVCYMSQNDAMKAQRALHSLVLGNSVIAAEFVSDAELARLLEMSNAGAAPSGNNWSQGVNTSTRPPYGGPKYDHSAQINGAAGFGGSNMWSGSSSLWGPPPIEEHPEQMLHGGLLGGH